MNSSSDSRPDPDALLSEVKQRGKLKIFLGAAPGVGKTFAMLTEAHEKRKEGLDVIIGWVDTHKRPDTEALLKGLEMIPRQTVKLGEHSYERLDIDAIIKRRPALVVIDEMPHSNAPESRHLKRWQDIEEILDFGIDVYSALNIQHLESLNSVVSRVTGVDVSETVPDRIFDKADEVRLVDLPPEDLLKRLEAGKIYLPEVIERARANYFKRSNLIALRELSLRLMANRVDIEVKKYRSLNARRRVDDTVFGLVLVIDAQTDKGTIQQASRLSRSLSSEWHCIWISEGTGSKANRDKAVEKLSYAQVLGAKIEVLMGAFAPTLSNYCRIHNLSIVAFSKKSNLNDILHRRNLKTLAPELNVLTLSSDSQDKGRSIKEKLLGFFHDSISFDWRGLIESTALVLLISFLIHPFAESVQTVNIFMSYLLVSLFAAVRFGMVMATYSTVLSIILFDITLVPPYWSLKVTDIQYVFTFLVMLIVGLIAARLVSSRQEMAIEAHRREHQTRMLYEVARAFSATTDEASVYQLGRSTLKTELNVDTEFWSNDGDDELVREQAVLPSVDRAILRWCEEHGKPAGQGTHTLSSSPYLYLPIISSSKEVYGVAVLRENSADTLNTSRHLIEALMTLMAQTLERLENAEEARQTLMNMEAERFRYSLIQTLSHDLQTPLTSLHGHAQQLVKDLRAQAYYKAKESAEVVVESTSRMKRLVSNLLEMARLQSNQIELNKEWFPAEELIGVTLSGLKERLSQFKVRVQIDPDCPFMYGDQTLLERLLSNLVDNATKYCPDGSTIIIEVKQRNKAVTLSVMDNGPGLPKNPQRLFDPFRRGQKESNVAGVGLGLAICRTIARVHGADLVALPSSLGGACFTLALPLVEVPDIEDEECEKANNSEHKPSTPEIQ